MEIPSNQFSFSLMPITVFPNGDFFLTLNHIFIKMVSCGVNVMDELTLDMVEEITRKDGSKYYEVGNMVQNGRAELAAERGFIQLVRILQLNIPHSQNVAKYEAYVIDNFEDLGESMDHWNEWTRNQDIEPIFQNILEENHIG